MSDHDNHGLTPTRPRVSVLEANVLEQLRDMRERVAALEAEREDVCDVCGKPADYVLGMTLRGGAWCRAHVSSIVRDLIEKALGT